MSQSLKIFCLFLWSGWTISSYTKEKTKVFGQGDQFESETIKHFMSNLEDIHKGLESCLTLNGVNKEGFGKCYGEGNHLLDRRYERVLRREEVEMKNRFKRAMKKYSEYNAHLCTELTESFNTDMLSNNNPVTNLKKIFKEYPLKIYQSAKISQAI